MILGMTHAFSGLDHELTAILDGFRAMGEGAVGMLEAVERGLTEGVSVHAETKTIDKRINDFEEALDGHVAEILSKYAPIGEDLRFTTAAPRIAASLERMGDMAKNTAKRLAKLSAPCTPGIAEGLLHMTRHIRRALPDCLMLIEHFDEPRALALVKSDKEVDGMFKGLFLQLETQLRTHPELIPDTAQLLLAAKNLERMGDHAANIARVAYYIHTGRKPAKSKEAAT